MARVVLFLCSLVSSLVLAQPPTTLTLGHSIAPLYGPWKFKVGDSPIDPATGQPLWAQANFDDSSWETVDLTPKGPANPFSGTDGYQPGWAEKGHPGYYGYAWYRIRVVVRADPGQRLALAPPRMFDDAYQYFLDGRLVGNFGRFVGRRPTIYYNEPQVFALPPARGEPQVIAFRLWASRASVDVNDGAGGFHLPPLLGTADAIAAEYQLGWLHEVRENLVWALMAMGDILLGVVALMLFLFNRNDRVYFWMAALLFCMGSGGAETALAQWTQTLPIPVDVFLCYVLVLPVQDFVWIMLLREWFQLKRPRWLPWVAAFLSLLHGAFLAAQYDLLAPLVTSHHAPIFADLSLWVRVAFGALLTWLVFRGIRKNPVEGWLVFPGVVLAWSDVVARWLGLRRVYAPFGVSLSLPQITTSLLALGMCVLLIRRWVQSANEERRLKQEMRQAMEVQQVLIPEAVPQIPGFAIHSIYRPAGQVGGDFFQILPLASGGVLLCIGDVSGKGIPAALTVSLLVGTLGTLVRYTQRPGEILAAMNQRMLGRSRGGFTTCLLLSASPDGTVTVANAGHIAPYLNGAEVMIENGLPLGLAPEATYPETTFHQQPDQQLTLVTDGVVEARSATGELYGFERTAQIAGQPAESIAATAQSFGQDDDITVLTLTRLPADRPLVVSQPVSLLGPAEPQILPLRATRSGSG